MPQINFRVPPLLHERFLALCAERDVKASDFLREALERFVDGVDNAQYVKERPGAELVAQAKQARRHTPTNERFAGVDALTGEPLAPRGPMQKSGKK